MTTGADQHETQPRGAPEFRIGDELRGERATLGRSLLDVQRDLRIKAAYIAAIENADPGVFPNPSFIPGYVRSYARYLGRNPDEVYARFRAESGFVGPGAVARGRVAAAASGAVAARPAGVFRPDFPMAEPRRWSGVGLPSLPVSAIGSLLVMAGLAAGIGYGGWTVLQNIQRVQFAPVEETPLAMAAVDAVPAPETPVLAAEPALEDLARPVAAAALADLYRQQEVEVPILAPRDGPIAKLDPNMIGLLAGHASVTPPSVAAVASGSAPVAGARVAAADATSAPAGEIPTLVAGPPALTVVAERAAWIRVYLPDQTVIFERILETGETYSPPADIAAPLIWAGNSGSVYVRVGETLRGPLGSGTRAVRDIPLEPEAIAARFDEVEQVPEAISGAFEPPIESAAMSLR